MPPATQDLPAPQLCDSIQGVVFWIRSPGGQPLRCVITEAALQAHFSASDDEASWLDAFLQYRGDIEMHAREASGRRDDVHVVLVTDSAGRLKAAVGRCGG